MKGMLLDLVISVAFSIAIGKGDIMNCVMFNSVKLIQQELCLIV